MNLKLDNYTITHQLKWRSIHLPNQLALCYLADGEIETERLTYRELDNAAMKIASKLQSLNLRNKHVLLLYSSGLEFVKAFFGCLYLGAIAVPTYVPKSDLILKKIELIQQDCNAKLILTTEDIIQESHLKNSKLAELPIVATELFARENQNETYKEINSKPEDVIFIQYTSGSTSQPKGAMVTNTNIMVNQVMLQHVFELNEKSVGITWLPLFHDMGLIASLLNAIFVGYPIYIMPPSAFIRKPVRWLQCITKYKGTYTCAPNFAYDLCIKNIPIEQRAELDLSSLRKAINASEPVRPETLQEFTKEFSPYGFREKAFTPAYGLAEATVFVTGKSDTVIKYVYLENKALKNNKIVYSERPENATKFVSCGLTHFLGQEIKIINPVTLEEVTDEIGEICISGPHIVKGYLNKPEANKETFGLKIDNKNFLRTGDLGFIDKGDHLYITGRMKDLIIINGSNYYPQDIELTIETTTPFIRNSSVAAFAVEINKSEHLVVVVELNRKMLTNFDPEKLGSDIRSNVFHNNALIIYEIIFIPPGNLPKTTSGKIQRHACKKLYLEDKLNIKARWKSPYEPERETTKPNGQPTEDLYNKTDIQNCIIEFIANKLKIDIDIIKPSAKFSDFNFDSIQLSELSAELEKIIKQSPSEKIFYEKDTIEDISKSIVEDSYHKFHSANNNVYQMSGSNKVKPTRKIAIPQFKGTYSKKIS